MVKRLNGVFDTGLLINTDIADYTINRSKLVKLPLAANQILYNDANGELTSTEYIQFANNNIDINPTNNVTIHPTNNIVLNPGVDVVLNPTNDIVINSKKLFFDNEKHSSLTNFKCTTLDEVPTLLFSQNTTPTTNYIVHFK